MACRDDGKSTPEKDENDEKNNKGSNRSGLRSFEFKTFRGSFWHNGPPLFDFGMRIAE
jgi:hypothetical protein